MANPDYLTADDLVIRWKGVVGRGTLANWRSAKKRRGPPFVKIGGRVLYPVKAVEEWEAANETGGNEECKN